MPPRPKNSGRRNNRNRYGPPKRSTKDEEEKAEKLAKGQKVEEEKTIEQLEAELEKQNEREGSDDDE